MFPVFIGIINFVLEFSVIKLGRKAIKLNNLKKFLIVAVLIGLIISPVEVFLRHKYAKYETNSYMYTIDSFHPFLQSQLNKTENIEVNSYGFRGEEITKEKPEGVFRIFVVGGSTVLNREVSLNESAVKLLEIKIKKQFPDKKIEMVNAGKDWYTTEHSIIQYLFKIKDFHPDMIILLQGVNDMYQSCTSPEFTTKEYKNDYSHFLGPMARIILNSFKPQPVISFKLLSFDFLMRSLKDNLYSDVVNSILKKKNESGGIYSKNLIIQTYNKTEFESINSFERNLSEFISILKNDNVKLILADQPFLYSNSLNDTGKGKIFFPKMFCTKNGKYPSLESIIKGMNLFNSRTRMLAEKSNTPFISLDSKIPKTIEYFFDDVHFTPKGNEKVSDSIFNFLIDGNMFSNL